MRHEGDAELTEHVNLSFLELVLLVRSRHREAELLADDVVERDRQPVGSEQEQNHTVDAVEFTPLRFLAEQFFNRVRLTPLSHGERHAFVVVVYAYFAGIV